MRRVQITKYSNIFISTWQIKYDKLADSSVWRVKRYGLQLNTSWSDLFIKWFKFRLIKIVKYHLNAIGGKPLSPIQMFHISISIYLVHMHLRPNKRFFVGWLNLGYTMSRFLIKWMSNQVSMMPCSLGCWNYLSWLDYVIALNIILMNHIN